MIELSPLDVIDPLERASRAIFSWAALDMSLNARTPQVPTFERDAAATVSDFAGTSYDVVKHQPAWHFVSELPTLLLADDDLLSWLYARRPGAMSGMKEFIHRSGQNTDGGVFSIANEDATGPRLYIAWDGSAYTLVHDNDDDPPVDSTLLAAPANGDSVRLRWELFADGSVRLHQSINGAAETSAVQSDPADLADEWGDVTRLWLNSIGASNPGEAAFRRIVIVPGSGRTLDQLEATY